MNIYVNDEIRNKFKCLDFRGKKWKSRNGKSYIRAYHRTLHTTMYYCFEEDFAWFSNTVQDLMVAKEK